MRGWSIASTLYALEHGFLALVSGWPHVSASHELILVMHGLREAILKFPEYVLCIRYPRGATNSQQGQSLWRAGQRAMFKGRRNTL
jgi:hypothetical protein